MDFKSLNSKLNMGTLKRLTSAQATRDLNAFLENLPQTAGQTGLIIAGIVWASGAALGLYTFLQVQSLIELRAELAQTQALVPSVPTIRDAPVPQAQLAGFAQTLSSIYPGIDIRHQGANIQITARSAAAFGVFREAVGHVQNGGDGWRVGVERMCVGRECDRDQLGILLRINKVSVDRPT